MVYGYRLTQTGLARVEATIAERFSGAASQSAIADSTGINRNTYRRLLQKDKNSGTVSLSSIKSLFSSLKLPISEADYETADDQQEAPGERDPFFWPSPIRNMAYFRGRKREINQLRTAHFEGENVQIVGDRKIGKSSLLNFCNEHAVRWNCQPIFLNGGDERLHSQQGFCSQIAQALNRLDCVNLTDLSELVETTVNSANQNTVLYPALYLDDFPAFYEAITPKLGDDHLDFWITFRQILGHGLRFITTSREPLAKILKDHPDKTFSGFMGMMRSLPLRGFTETEARAFVSEERASEFTFPSPHQHRLLSTAREYDFHPLALQILCSFSYDAILDGRDDIDAVIDEAGELLQEQYLIYKRGDGGEGR